MEIVARIASSLIRRWVWFFFPVMAVFLAGIFYGWGFNVWTALMAAGLVMIMSLAACLAWFWLNVFKAVAAKPEPDFATSGAHNDGP